MNNAYNESLQKLRSLLNSIVNLKDDKKIVEFKPINQFERGYIACLLAFIDYLKMNERSMQHDIFNNINKIKESSILQMKIFDDEWIKGYKIALQDVIHYLENIKPKKSSADTVKDNPRKNVNSNAMS